MKNSLCFCSAILFCLFPTTAVFADEVGVIIAFGDSLTEGCGNEVSSCGVTPRPGDCTYDYETILKALLTENRYEFTVHNFGVGGETTVDGINRLPYVFDNACNQRAEYILLLEGTNDLLHGAMGANVKFNLGIMIDMSRENGLEPLLATLPPDSEPDNQYKNIPLMNQYIRELAVEKNVTLVEQYNALEPNWGTYTNPRGCYGDLTHPNSTGFDVIGTVWYESLTDVLPPPAQSLAWVILLLNTQ